MFWHKVWSGPWSLLLAAALLWGCAGRELGAVPKADTVAASAPQTTSPKVTLRSVKAEAYAAYARAVLLETRSTARAYAA